MYQTDKWTPHSKDSGSLSTCPGYFRLLIAIVTGDHLVQIYLGHVDLI